MIQRNAHELSECSGNCSGDFGGAARGQLEFSSNSKTIGLIVWILLVEPPRGIEPGLIIANDALYQLSYGPIRRGVSPKPARLSRGGHQDRPKTVSYSAASA